MLPVAIIGAGLAGLAAARALAAAGQPARLFDKGRAPGGRLATRRVLHAGAEHRFDHGAQYLRAERAPFAALLKEAGCAPWPDPARRVAVPGMSALGRHMAKGLDVTTGVTIAALREEAAGWHLVHEGGAQGPFAAVLVTVPAPQAIPLLAPHRPAMGAALARIRYAPCWTVLASFAARLDLPDTLRDHGIIGWAARDSAKPGRDAAQENWVIQAGPGFSRAHLEDAPESVIAPLLAALPSPEPLFASAHRWRFSLLEQPLGEDCLLDGALGYASDGCLGGRAEAAFESGAALAARHLASR
jgi:predicted NAD/FAD-dependent oxidoreductase